MLLFSRSGCEYRLRSVSGVVAVPKFSKSRFPTGRDEGAGDFVYYDLPQRCLIDEATAKVLADQPHLPVTSGHPTGFDLSSLWDGSDSTAEVCVPSDDDEMAEGPFDGD